VHLLYSSRRNTLLLINTLLIAEQHLHCIKTNKPLNTMAAANPTACLPVESSGLIAPSPPSAIPNQEMNMGTEWALPSS